MLLYSSNSTVSAHYHVATTGPDNPPLACPPDDMNLVDLAREFVLWSEQNLADEALMGELPVRGLIRAAVAKWPCPAESS